MAPPITIKGPVCTIYFRQFPRKIKREFKAWCDRRGLTMKEGFIQFIEAVTKMSFCEWCQGSGTRSFPDDKAPPGGPCSMCDGSGFHSIVNKL